MRRRKRGKWRARTICKNVSRFPYVKCKSVLERRGHARGPRPQSRGFLVVQTRTGAILSDLKGARGAARDEIERIVATLGRASPIAGDVEYRSGKWYEPLGVHQVMLYPGETYSRETYKP